MRFVKKKIQSNSNFYDFNQFLVWIKLISSFDWIGLDLNTLIDALWANQPRIIRLAQIYFLFSFLNLAQIYFHIFPFIKMEIEHKVNKERLKYIADIDYYEPSKASLLECGGLHDYFKYQTE